MALKIQSPLAKQDSPLFILDNNTFDEVLGRLDFHSIVNFRLTCQKIRLWVNGSRPTFWRALLVTYFPDYVKNTWLTPMYIANPRYSFFHICNNMHDMFVKILKSKGFDVSETCKKNPWLINSKYWKQHDATPLIELVSAYNVPSSTIPMRNMDFVSILSKMLENGADINYSNTLGKTALLFAIEKDIMLAKFLIGKGANVNLKGKDDYTPLFIAVLGGSYEMVKLLIDRGANVNERLKNGTTLLHIAAQKNLHEIGEFLIDNGALLEATYFNDDYTPLFIAVLVGSYEMVKLLIDRGANVNAQHKNGATPLHLAAIKNLHEIGELLIKKGAKVDVQTTKGNTPQQLAKENGASEMVKLLEPLTPPEELPLKKWKGE